jgi:23S rRNA pseudouridine1911/1915/1917 synthase
MGRRSDGQTGSGRSERPAGDETESSHAAPPPARPSAHPPIEFCVSAEHTERLDRFLADQLQLSRTQAARLIADKAVQVDGGVARASRVLARGARVTVAFPTLDPPRQLRPAPIPLTIVWEDEHLAVIDKPAGLVVHPAPGHWDDTLVNALVARGTALGGGVQGRPGIVHRLDRDTSGLMLVAKTDVAHRRLSQLLGARRIVRAYAALTWGHLAESPTVIEAPLARHPRDRKRMAIIATGRAARTDAYLIARFASTDLLRLELHTGRTHQIRVHLEQAGHPVVGDPVYAGGGSRRISGAARPSADALERATPRQALHAAWLAFRHPLTDVPLEFRSEWPADLRPALGLAGGGDLVARPDPLAYLLFFNRHE